MRNFPAVIFLLAYSVIATAEEAPLKILKELSLTPKEISSLLQRKVVTRTLPTADKRELALLGAMLVQSPPESIAAAVRDITEFKKGKEVLAIGKFEQFNAEEMKKLTLEESEIAALKECEAEDCALKLPVCWIEELNNAKDPASSFTKILSEYAREYRDAGGKAVVKYNNKEDELDSQKEFESILNASTYLKSLAPSVQKYLAGFPGEPLPGSDSFIYWSEEKFGFKPVVSLTHVTLVPWSAEGAQGWLIASRQIYADHYYDASLGLTFLMQTNGAQKDKPATYLVYINRSRVDILAGFLSSLRRAIAVPRIRSGMETHMKGFRSRLEEAKSGPDVNDSDQKK
jgi:hypothetical protein